MAFFYNENGDPVPSAKYIVGIPVLILIICGMLAIAGVL